MADFMAHTLVSDANKDVLRLSEMIEESEKAEIERKEAAKKKIAGEIFEDEHKDDGDDSSITDWLNDIKAKDEQLKKVQQDQARSAGGGGAPPVRNAGNKKTKNVQVGMSDVEKEKAEKKKGKEVGEDGVPKHQKYYQYDYFKEWDKFDVDKEIERLEEEDRKRDENKAFAKKAADPYENYSDPNDTYKVETMTPMERRMAAQREKEKGNECMKCGETNAAVQYYSKSLELSPGNHLVLGNRAQAYIGIRCYLQAEMDCDQALAVEPTYTKAKYRRAVACKEQGKFAEAVRDLEDVLSVEAEHKGAQALLRETRQRKAEKEKEEETKRKEAEERAKYEAAPRRKIAIQEVEDDDDEEDEDDGLDKKAMEQARESVRLKKEEEERLLKLEAVRRKKDEGNAAVKAKDFTQAARHYTAAIKLLPAGDKEEAHLVYSNRAHVYIQQGEFVKAEEDCTAALKANSQWAKAQHRRGVARAELGRYEEALADLEKALKLECNSKQTIEEIKRVRAMQADQRKNASAGGGAKRVEIVEVDSDSDETDSSDDDVVVINKAGASPSGGDAGADEGEIIEDEETVTASAPASAAPASNRVKVQIVEDDSEEEEEEEEEEKLIIQGPFVACDKFKGSRPGYVFKMGDSGLGYYIDSKSKASHPPPVKATPLAAPASTASNRVKIEIESDSDDATEEEEEEEEENQAISPAHRVQVEIIESEEEEEEKAVGAPPAPAPVAVPELIAWEIRGRDAARLSKAKGVKDEADALFKKGLFEQAAEVYSTAVGELGDEEDYQHERCLCYNNRAACRLQIRDYAATIADCGEVLCVDGDNVKALVRRAMSYEGLERYGKAATDCRQVLSIEFASGAGLSNMGIKARDCLERCKKHDPEQRSIPIPTRPAAAAAAATSPPAAAAPAKSFAAAGGDAGKGGSKEKEAKRAEIAARVEAAKKASAASAVPKSDSRSDSKKKEEEEEEEKEKEKEKGKGKGKEKGKGKGKEEEEEDPKEIAAKKMAAFEAQAKEAKVREATACKERGNASFKAGKYHNAIMHYSAAIDLVDDDATFYTNLAAAHFQLKDFENALKMASKGVRLDGNNAKAHYRKAQALESMGKLAESEEAYKAGLALLPESEQLKNGLSSVRERLRASKNVEADALAKIKEMAKEKQDKDKAMAEEETKKASLAAQASAAKTPAAAAAVSPSVVGHGGASGGGNAAGRSVPVSGAALKRQIKNLGKDSAKLWGYLGEICGDSVGKLLVSGLEEEELMPIVKALEEHGVASDARQSWRVIKSVASVPRVGITCKMLDRRDSTKLETLLLKLHPAKASAAGHTVEEYAAVRKALGV